MQQHQVYTSLITILLAPILFSFQNCSSSVAFENRQAFNKVGAFDLDSVICNPLGDQEECDPLGQKGLVGNLYYMLPDQHENLFDGELINARLKDYRTHGVKVPNLVFMNQVNTPPQSWASGFIGGDGELIADNSDQVLNEWFHLDLYGNISLPVGEYEFATLSDDGMKISFDEVVHIDHDNPHAPAWKCSEQSVTFSVEEKKQIRVEYFQGPRYQIAMQLFYRLKGSGEGCNENGNWLEVPADSFSH